MNRAPTPKYATTSAPELTFGRLNSVGSDGCCGLFVGRQYKISRRKIEHSRPYIEKNGVLVYIPEEWLHKTLQNGWDEFTK